LVIDTDARLALRLLDGMPNWREPDICLVDPMGLLVPSDLDVRRPPSGVSYRTGWEMMRLCAGRHVGLNLLARRGPEMEHRTLAEAMTVFEALLGGDPASDLTAYTLKWIPMAGTAILTWRPNPTLADLHRFIIDPEEALVAIVMVQKWPYDTRLLQEFETLVYQAIIE